MLSILYTFLIVLFPIISIYSLGILSFTLADGILILLTPLLFFSILRCKEGKIKIHKGICILVGAILLHLTIIILLGRGQDNNLSIILQTLRYCIYLLFVGIFVKDFFNVSLGLKFLKIVTIFSTIYLILQFILLKGFNFYLSGFIPGLPLNVEDLNNLEQLYTSNIINRPRSIFQEPAHYASYVLVYLGLTLFNNVSKEKYTALMITIGLILANSSTGLLTMAILLILYLFNYLSKIRKIEELLKYTAIVASIVILCILFSQTEIFKSFIDRTFVTGNATKGRLGTYTIIFNDVSLIGNGMKDFYMYLPGIPRLYYYFGIIGILVFLIISVQLLLKKTGYRRIIVFILLISTIGTEIILGRYIVLYLPFILGKNEFKSKKKIRVLVEWRRKRWIQ